MFFGAKSLASSLMDQMLQPLKKISGHFKYLKYDTYWVACYVLNQLHQLKAGIKVAWFSKFFYDYNKKMGVNTKILMYF